MRPLIRMLLVIALLFVPAPSHGAQAPVDPAGHWEGTIHAPETDVVIGLDVFKNSKGQLAANFAQAADGIKAFPLSDVQINGSALRLVLRTGSSGGTFNMTVSSDGRSMTGDFTTAEGGFVVPVKLTRTGDAQVASVAKSAPIGRELEGTWKGALELEGKQLRIELTMVNEADGASGTIVSRDGSGSEIPIVMTQKESSVTIDVPAVSGSFAGRLNDARTELAGTWTQGGLSLPLTLRRAQ